MQFDNLPNVKYKTVVIDPPWQQSMVLGYNVVRHKRPKQLPYKTMTIDEIKTFPVNQLSEPGGHVYLWTTNKFLHDAFHVLDAWGIRFHLCMPLVKKSGIVGANGYVFGSEYCLLGFNGKPMIPFQGIGKLNWLVTTPLRGTHSKKPDSFYSLVESMSAGPYLDCFARRTRDRWDSWGDECNEQAQSVTSADK